VSRTGYFAPPLRARTHVGGEGRHGRVGFAAILFTFAVLAELREQRSRRRSVASRSREQSLADICRKIDAVEEHDVGERNVSPATYGENFACRLSVANRPGGPLVPWLDRVRDLAAEEGLGEAAARRRSM